MLMLLSPAKDMALGPEPAALPLSRPRFMPQAEELMGVLNGLSPAKLASLMDLSPALAEEVHARHGAWRARAGKQTKAAALLFNGEAYRGLAFRDLGLEAQQAAQERLLILSGLYGVLRPCDGIMPYRLMMGTRFPIKRGVRDLYTFWADRVHNAVAEALAATGGDTVVNLASQEYARSAKLTALPGRCITPVFKDAGPKGYRTVSVYAKHQRGAMVHWALANGISDAEHLRAYQGDGYAFDPRESSASEWVFKRGAL